MSSLVSSIFGGGGGEEKAEDKSSSSLFENKDQFQSIPLKEDFLETKRRKKRKKTEEDAEKEAQRKKESEEAADKTIFVGNLPISITRKELAKLFSNCGAISSARIRSAPVTPVKVSQKGDFNLVRRVANQTGKLDSANKASVHGYVVFQKPESVKEALKKNNMSLPGDSSRRIRVDYAEPTWMQNTKRAVFVGNLPFDDPNAESDLQKHFAEHCGCSEEEIEGVRIVRDKSTYLGKGFGYVLLATNQLQSTALQYMPNTTYKNRTLRIMPCSTKNKNKKKRDQDAEKSADKKPRANYKGNSKPTDAVGALKRSLVKEGQDSGASKKKRRARGPSGSKPSSHKAGGGSKKTKASDKKLRKLIQNRVDQVRAERKRR